MTDEDIAIKSLTHPLPWRYGGMEGRRGDLESGLLSHYIVDLNGVTVFVADDLFDISDSRYFYDPVAQIVQRANATMPVAHRFVEACIQELWPRLKMPEVSGTEAEIRRAFEIAVYNQQTIRSVLRMFLKMEEWKGKL